MFRRLNNRQGQNNQNNQEPRILNEEEDSREIGNEALAENIAGGLIDLISNESKNEALENEIPQEIKKDQLDHYYQNDLINNKLYKAPKDTRDHRLDHYYQNDLNILDLKTGKRSPKKKTILIFRSFRSMMTR